jgi:palmitoyltransferase
MERAAKKLGKELEENEELEYYCDVCESYVGDRSKHCGDCNRCVDVFDHHCKWMNNCVGEKNYKAFIILITAVMI